MNNKLWLLSGLCLALTQVACHVNNSNQEQKNPLNAAEKSSSSVTSPSVNADALKTSSIDQKYQIEKFAQLNEPWALAALPNGHLLITEKRGVLKLLNPATKQWVSVAGVPKVAYAGQGGLGDVAVHPQYTKNHWVYLSYAEKGQGGNGAVVIRAELDLTQPEQPQLKNIKRIWEQVPKVSGNGHYAHRMVFDRQNKLWISSGERQKFNPSQDMNSNLGKIIHLNDDGSPSSDNPFYAKGGVSAQIWSLGHRNPLGLAFDSNNQLWVAEMGPEGGDELNRVLKGENYGYPIVSNGDHYDGKDIPDHHTRPEFKAPEIDWTPVISPSSLMVYQGDQFPQWKNKALISGLSSKSIVVVDITHQPVREVQRLQMGKRIRGLLQAQDGGIWVIEDEAGANLFKLKPQ